MELVAPNEVEIGDIIEGPDGPGEVIDIDLIDHDFKIWHFFFKQLPGDSPRKFLVINENNRFTIRKAIRHSDPEPYRTSTLDRFCSTATVPS